MRAFMRIKTRASLRQVISETVNMINMTKQHKCSCTGDCNEAVQTEGKLCVKCTTCTNGDCCKQDDTDEGDDDSREDDTKHDGRQGETCRGETAPGSKKVNTQRISPAARWSTMDASAWLRTLGTQTSLRYGAMTAKPAKRGDHMVVKSWSRETDIEDETKGAEHSEQMDTYHKAWEAAMLQRVLEAAEVDFDATELTMKLEQEAAQKEASDNKAKREAPKTMRKTLAAAAIMTLKMATHRPGAEQIRHWRLNMAIAQNNEKARQRASRALKLSQQAAKRTV